MFAPLKGHPQLCSVISCFLDYHRMTFWVDELTPRPATGVTEGFAKRRCSAVKIVIIWRG